MLRVVVAFFIVVNVALMLWLFNESGHSANATASAVPMLQGDRLILLSEVDLNELEEKVPDAPAEEIVIEDIEPLEEIAQPEQCVVAGPIQAIDQAEALVDQVSALGVSSKVYTEVIERPGSVMVYIEPFISAQEAQRELRVLQSSGIDSFVIADGELDKGISLGVFSTRQNALTQQVRIERLGYETNTRQFMIEEDRFYVNFSGETLEALEEDYWANIANEYKDISIEQKACNEVASEDDFQ